MGGSEMRRMIADRVCAVLVGVVYFIFASVTSGSTIQWSGNGHRYEPMLVGTGDISWTDAENAATASGGYLATITSAGESEFGYSLVSGNDDFWAINPSGDGIGPWLGGHQYDRSGSSPPGRHSWHPVASGGKLPLNL